MTSEKKKYLSGNLNQIALSLSGGGVRAVGFHLGTMSMLSRLGLLKNVQVLSSVSGGSLPGIGYSLAQQFGRSFQDFYDDFHKFLPEINIMEELFDGMASRQSPSPSGKRDMISALSNVYDEFYFQRFFGPYINDEPLTFKVLMDQPGKGHLDEMIFNSTEFKTGTAFRFQVSEFRCLIGNGNLSLCRKHASQIRIADIMAASSCIPVGMEPMFFPDDFRWPDDVKKGKRKNNLESSTNQEIRASLIRNTDTNEPTFALMDGGVYDNQGITSTLLALNRRKTGFTERDAHECGVSLSGTGRGEPPGPEDWARWMSGKVVESSNHQSVGVNPEDLDLLIISDTPVRKASFFPRVLVSKTGVPEPRLHISQAKGWWAGITGGIKSVVSRFVQAITVGQMSAITWFVLFGLFLSAITTASEYLLFRSTLREFGLFGTTLFAFHVVLPFILFVATALGIFFYKRTKSKTIEKLKELIPNWKRDPGKYINKLRISDLLKMGILRAGSTAALTSAIFMDRIRGLGYSTAFSRPDLREKILTNEIFALLHDYSQNDSFHTMLRNQEAWPPPPELGRIVGVAATMPTKLWIDQDKDDPLSDLDYLIVCGQATICYNLMKFLWEELREDDGTWVDAKMGVILEAALKEWKKLMDDPLSLLKDRARRSRLPKLNEQAEVLQALIK